MATAPTIIDTPTGFQVVNPLQTIDSAMVIDLKCSMANDRMLRNILNTRVGVRSSTQVHHEISFTLTAVTSGPNKTFTHTLPAEAKALVLISNREVQISVTNANGTLNMGVGTMFVLTSNLISVTVTNTLNAGTAEVSLVSI